MLKPKKWFMNQWIWKELCTSQNKTLSAFTKIENLFRFQCIDFTSERVAILREFLSTIWLTATGLCNARGRLMLQMQGLIFLGKLDFRFLHKNGCQETLNISWVSNWNHWSQMVSDRTFILSKQWPLTSKLFGSLDLFLTFETSGIGKNEKSPLHSLLPTHLKINKSHVITKLPSLLQFGPLSSKYGRFL